MHENFDKLFNKMRYEKDNLFLYNKRFKISIIIYNLIKFIESCLFTYIVLSLNYLINYVTIDIVTIIKVFVFSFLINIMFSFFYIILTFNLCINNLNKKDIILLKNNECFKKYKIPKFVYNMITLKSSISNEKEVYNTYKLVINNILLTKWIIELNLDSKIKTKMLKFLISERKNIKEKLSKSDSNIFENAIKYDNLNSFIDTYTNMTDIIQTSNLFKIFNLYLTDYIK